MTFQPMLPLSVRKPVVKLDTKKVFELRERGMISVEIARETGASEEEVYRHRVKIKEGHSSIIDVQKDRIKAYIEQGKSFATIATLIGMSTKKVSKLASEMGMSSPTPFGKQASSQTPVLSPEEKHKLLHKVREYEAAMEKLFVEQDELKAKLVGVGSRLTALKKAKKKATTKLDKHLVKDFS